MAYTLIQIQTYLFIISQVEPEVSFPFLIFKESSSIVLTFAYPYCFNPVSHYETANGIHYIPLNETAIYHIKILTQYEMAPDMF